jgi:hypothetical protein
MGFKYSGYDRETLEEEYSLTCDDCGARARHPSRHGVGQVIRGPIASLLDRVTKLGWTTRPAAKRSDPRQWVCPECRNKMRSSDDWWGSAPKAAVRA